VTSLFFDLGVFLVVVGLVLDILRSLGAEIDRRAETGEDPVGSDASGGETEGDVPAQVSANARPAGWDGSVP
jgi:multicomponent Na+:H+ antiporter subunit A